MTKEERIDAASEELAAAIEGLVSGEDWQAMLEVAAKLHKYSANNIMLIMSQKPEATMVAGYGDWQKKFNRQVQKGEKGIKILAPCIYKGKDKETGDDVLRVRGFRVVNVFDVSQTDGEEVVIVKPKQLEGDGIEGLFLQVAELIVARGFVVRREAIEGSANGYTNMAMREVVVDSGVSDAQAAKTIIHELAHVILHQPGNGYNPFENRDQGEVEAESVAYIVARTVGLETGEYSFPYVARWARGDMKVVQGAADVAIKTARLIVEELEVQE